MLRVRYRACFAGLLACAIPALAEAPAGPSIPSKFKPEPQEQFVCYWTAEPGWHTELMLRNNLETAALVVTPALRLESGTEIPLAPVTITPSSVTSVNLHEALMQSHPEVMTQTNAYGSVVIRYTALSHSNLYASVMIHDDGYPIVYHVDGTAMEPDSGRGGHEGIWWLPKASTKGYLILTNMSQKQQSGVLWLYDQAGHSSKQAVGLLAQQTIRFPLPDLISASGLPGDTGGVSFRMDQGVGTISAALLLFDEPSGFSAIMKTFIQDPSVTLKSHDFAGTGKWTTRAPLLALEHPDPALQLPSDAVLHPQVIVRNTTAQPMKAQLSIHWRNAQSDGRLRLPEMTLAPEETRVVDIQQLQENGTVPASAYWAQLTLTTDTLPNEAMAVAASFDPTLRYGAQTPFSDQLAFHFEGSAWQVDAAHDSIIAAGNGSSTPVKARLTFFYGSGGQKYEIDQTIAPDDEMLVDVGKLIRERIPDTNGNVLPGDLTTGAYRLRDLAETPGASLYEGKVVTDKTWGHATYGCAVCCGYRGVYFSPDPGGVSLQFQEGVNATGIDACGSGTSIVDGYATSWTSGNTSILTVQPHQIQGVSAGSTGHYAELSNIIYGPPMDADPCPLQDVAVNGTGNVNPYTYQDYNNWESALLGYTSISPNGDINGAELDPDAYNYLVSAGFLSSSSGTLVWEVPTYGNVTIWVTAVYISLQAAKALELWSEARGLADPKLVRTLGASHPGTKDSNGNCETNSPPTPNYKWEAVNLTGPSAGILHWHWVEWHLNASTCIWYLSRYEGQSDPGPGYVLIPGLY